MPVVEADQNEMLGESQWIFKHLFQEKPVSNQDISEKLMNVVVPKIGETLNFIRNQDFEVQQHTFSTWNDSLLNLNIADVSKRCPLLPFTAKNTWTVRNRVTNEPNAAWTWPICGEFMKPMRRLDNLSLSITNIGGLLKH